MLFFVAIGSVSLIACNNAETKTEPAAEVAKEEPMAPAPAAKDVVDIAIGSTDHTTLVAAVTAAGLVETLKPKFCSRIIL